MQLTAIPTMTVAFEQCYFGYNSRHPVLQDFNLTLDTFPVALLGPNGAGKSTLLSLLATRYELQSGAIQIGEVRTDDRRGRAEMRRIVGWAGQDTTPLPGFRVLQQLYYSAWLRGLSRKQARSEAARVLDTVDLTALADARVKDISGGQRRRLGIAQALLGSPPVLLLDEPYAGLDPYQRKILSGVIRNVSQEASVIVSTHQTNDLLESYRSVAVMSSGQILYHGSTSDFVTLGDPALTEDRTEAAYSRIMIDAGQTD